MTLPSDLACLIKVAHDDLVACERDPRYVINMSRWHEPRADGKCLVCLAGAVMAKTMKIPVDLCFGFGLGGYELHYNILNSLRQAIEYGYGVTYSDRPNLFKTYLLVYRDYYTLNHLEISDFKGFPRIEGLNG